MLTAAGLLTCRSCGTIILGCSRRPPSMWYQHFVSYAAVTQQAKKRRWRRKHVITSCASSQRFISYAPASQQAEKRHCRRGPCDHFIRIQFANPGQAGAAARMLRHWGGGFRAHLSRYRRLNMSVLLFRRCRRYTSVADSCGYLALNGSAVRST